MSAISDIGLIGLAVMGQNLAFNIASRGIPISVYNRSSSKTDDTLARYAADDTLPPGGLTGYPALPDFVASLKTPRKIILLVKAGAPVDATLDALVPLLSPDDLVIDGGNEFYTNTERRAKDLQPKGIRYMGMGVSGGEEGARYGPSLMPGGDEAAYKLVEPVLTQIAAQVDGAACVTYIGKGGAGNYVKMVHNGIEYGDMQLIGEAYDVLRRVAGATPAQLADVFSKWNVGELDSFLIEITAKIMATPDDLQAAGGAASLVDAVLDQTGSKGTGMWTIEEAARRGVPAPTIAAALDARYISAAKPERLAAAAVLAGPAPPEPSGPLDAELVEDVRRALYAAKICSYAQGMNLIRKAAADFGWDTIDLGAIAKIWKGGCIIRAKFLDRIRAAYERDPQLASLLVDPGFAADLERCGDAWRRVVVRAFTTGVPVPAFAASLAYYDAYRTDVLKSSQLVQAQRDFFGAHTYKRLDKDGVYHTRWSSDGVSEKH